MATNAEIAAKLLRDAATFFRHVGEQNDPIKDQMDSNAQAYDTIAELVETEPTAEFDLIDQR
ncbi:hypothetical protein GGE65_002577 [Skermanella aerolata]|jgi:hypothetical protein|uniref:Uncharacterized protein n=1 Tax=Skermanella aerolata TaxID=393310 RepID=A0A512DQ90_9PROT|nr:hypothetical protein [Skermanella aerolata]KJB93465.1 hypothetical protein N826_17610 [Skermanella aerolata KACC 11604]GEO38651.1 hypothetical protein SAE02_27990 [Skermanella aerolata]HYI69182.1 hypothetical protein [Skermanella sp.]